jgi:serine/threonine protein kinase
VSTDIDVNIEPLPGYRLIEHIGTGGYGEVWRAEAPGGLYKAIKFVFGQQHEKRATNELRALDHVRTVRHPFLLSLERIEVVDGRVIVVTELADGSVKDRFDACRREGLSGIPRAELLGYLRDAADALDFMSESHALQHLDIKPENLLLLAGHVKVADFGLVKDVRQSQASLVGGMTPLYAAPEVFRGSPSRQSDQYSLAIVYQEMLSGSLPFIGGNAAELTLQHLNDEPELSSLSIVDRYVVSRALSKDPHHRYTNCREFVESLLRAQPADSKGGSSTTVSLVPCDVECPSSTEMRSESSQGTTSVGIPTDVFDDAESSVWRQSCELLVELATPNRRIRDLPPCDLTRQDPSCVPTLVLGLGGAAGRVLAHFRKSINDRFGNNSIPAVQFLLIDTDSRALASASSRDGARLSPDETLNLPLRRPQHYRDNAQQLLSWLSRRWLYNIPRSLRTEGLRPLGRLALADHARQAGQRIRRSIMQAMEVASTAASSQAVRREFRSDAIRVFVVASISGGTGGGMSLDIAYAARTILNKLAVRDARVNGLMIHSTGGDPRSCELARVNALSWLTEYHHFTQPAASYPGDVSCGLPSYDAGVPPFDSTYLIHLGDNLNEVEFDQATQSIAEYLRLNTLTPAGAFFDACRESMDDLDRAANGSAQSLRSFGLYQRSAAPAELCDEFASVVSRHVLASWRPGNRTTRASHSSECSTESISAPEASAPLAMLPGAEQLLRRLRFDATGLAANARALIETELGEDPAAFLWKWLTEQSAGGDAAPLSIIDKLFSSTDSNVEGARILSLCGKPITAIVGPFAEKMRSELRRWVSVKFNERPGGPDAAWQGSEWLLSTCRAMEIELQSAREHAADRLLEFRREIANNTRIATTQAEHENNRQRLLAYFNMRLDLAANLAAERVLQLVICDAKGRLEELTTLGREIEQIANVVDRACGDTAQGLSNTESTTGATDQASLAKLLFDKLPEIAAEVDRQIHVDYINPQGGLAEVVMGGGRPRAQLTAKLHELSRGIVQRLLTSINLLAHDVADGQLADELRSVVAMATPTMLEFGGTRRVLSIVPRDSAGTLSPEVLSKALGTAVTSMPGTDNNFAVCAEAGQLSLPHIAASFVEHRRDRVEFAGRVHSRTDVTWMPLFKTTTSEPVSWSGLDGQARSRDAMSKTLVI